MVVTRQQKPERRTILAAPDNLEELLSGEVIGNHREPHAMIVLDGPDGVAETHALFVLDHHQGPRGVTRFRGQLQSRPDKDGNSLHGIIEGLTDPEAPKSVPVRGHFCPKTRCGSVTFLRV